MSNYEFTDDSYVDDGYLFTGRPVIFQSGATRIELRGPAKRSGSIRLLQAEEYSSGWARYGYAPLAIVHTLTLEYQQLRSDEVDQLKAFQTAVDYSAGTFSYIDGASGLTVPAWFASPEQNIEEASFNKHGATIELHSLSPFVALPAAPANIDAILNAAHYPCSVRITRKQPQVWMSDGTRRVSNKSAITRQLHTLALVRLTSDQLGALIAHFIGADGMKNRWTWTVSPEYFVEGTTNDIRYSDDITNAAWVKNSATIDYKTISIVSYIYQSLPGSYVGLPAATASITISGTPGKRINLYLMNGSATVGSGIQIILTATPTRYSVTANLSGATDGVYLFLYTVGFLGVPAADSNHTIIMSNMQVEQKEYATSYVPTTSAPATRPDSYTPAVTHTCRHAHTALDWQQSPLRSDRYDLNINLEEDL